MSISRSLNFSIFQSSIKDDIEELEDEIDEDYDDDYDWGKKIHKNLVFGPISRFCVRIIFSL